SPGLLRRLVVGLDSGFAAFPRIDPHLLADISGDGTFSGLDAAYLSQEAVGRPRPEIPSLPGPIVSLTSPVSGTAAGGNVTVQGQVHSRITAVTAVQFQVDGSTFSA